MRSALVVVLLSTALHLCGSAVNYCGAKMCGYTDAHTFCQYPDGPSPSCVGYIQAPLTPEEKGRILNRLNRRRSDVATGRLRNFPTAGDMLKLRWVEDLAREAQRWADQCRPPQTPDEHDACRDLYSVSVGQNVASVVGEAPGLRAESMVDMWSMQSKHHKGNVTNYMPPMSTINYYGDFAQIVWSYTYMVGCGRSRFMIQLKGRMRTVERLVCNFAPRGPISGQAMWSPDEPSALCPPRSLPDTEFRGLCAYQPYLLEVSNNMTTIEDNTLLNTIFEIEMNDILNFPGSLDEVYLTKIAIATLEDKAKTEPYSSFQKRDIELMMNNDVNNNLQESDKGVVHLVKIQETKRFKPIQTTVKIKLMGRYKSYNADDLIDVGGVQTTQNYGIPADLPKERSEFYADYQYVDTIEGESVSTESTVGVSETSSVRVQKSTDNFNNNSEMTYPLKNLTLNVTYGFGGEFEMRNFTFNQSIENHNTNHIAVKEDEFLSDPETVRDLELALRQMEQTMETSTITTAASVVGSEQVELDLRQKSKSNGSMMESMMREAGTSPLHFQDLNMTVDKAPMLNMILKYLPYLKPYQNELMGRVTNNAMIVTPCVVCSFAFIICLV